MGKIIRVKSTVWEEYYFDDDEYAEVMEGLKSGTLQVHEMYERSYDNEINYDTIDSLKDSNGEYIIEDDDGNNPLTGRPASNQPDPTVIKYPINNAWKPGMTFKDMGPQNSDEELIL